jgi:hypothetical protein
LLINSTKDFDHLSFVTPGKEAGMCKFGVLREEVKRPEHSLLWALLLRAFGGEEREFFRCSKRHRRRVSPRLLWMTLKSMNEHNATLYLAKCNAVIGNTYSTLASMGSVIVENPSMPISGHRSILALVDVMCRFEDD